jgi:hypothetical protein
VRGEVADHAPVEDVGEVALEGAPRLLLGVAVGARLGVDALDARLGPQLGDGHPVKQRVDAPVVMPPAGGDHGYASLRTLLA